VLVTIGAWSESLCANEPALRFVRPQVGISTLKLRFFAVLPCVLLLAGICNGQSTFLDLPLQSQQAVVTQRIGLTDITIKYHRPLVNGRKIFGGLEPYGKVWRAGANVNTTISFSDPVGVEGKALARGTYGLHMVPGEDQWTVIFSNASKS
jgi:DUF2911 family protein